VDTPRPTPVAAADLARPSRADTTRRYWQACADASRARELARRTTSLLRQLELSIRHDAARREADGLRVDLDTVAGEVRS
jgi:hypothetical protein